MRNASFLVLCVILSGCGTSALDLPSGAVTNIPPGIWNGYMNHVFKDINGNITENDGIVSQSVKIDDSGIPYHSGAPMVEGSTLVSTSSTGTLTFSVTDAYTTLDNVYEVYYSVSGTYNNDIVSGTGKDLWYSDGYGIVGVSKLTYKINGSTTNEEATWVYPSLSYWGF